MNHDPGQHCGDSNFEFTEVFEFTALTMSAFPCGAATAATIIINPTGCIGMLSSLSARELLSLSSLYTTFPAVSHQMYHAPGTINGCHNYQQSPPYCTVIFCALQHISLPFLQLLSLTSPFSRIKGYTSIRVRRFKGAPCSI